MGSQSCVANIQRRGLVFCHTKVFVGFGGLILSPRLSPFSSDVSSTDVCSKVMYLELKRSTGACRTVAGFCCTVVRTAFSPSVVWLPERLDLQRLPLQWFSYVPLMSLVSLQQLDLAEECP